MLTQFRCSIRGKKALIVNAYSPSWGAVQYCNIVDSQSTFVWVKRVYGKRLLKAEKVRVFRGVGR